MPTANKNQTDPTPETDPSKDKYAASQWGSSNIGGLTDLEVPSGQLCLVRRPGVEGLLKAGVLRDLDSFTALVNEAHVQRVKGRGKGKPSDRAPSAAEQQKSTEQAVGEMLSDPDKMTNLMHTLDRVTCYVVVKPEVQMTPDDVTRRKDGVVYADMIDMVDKMHILNFVVGGSRDVERFLEESSLPLGDMDAGQDVESEAK